jgi:hypothetical protein
MMKKRYLILAFTLVIGIFVVRILPAAPGVQERDTRWHLEHTRAELPRARQLWESHGITSYDINYYLLYHRGRNEGTLHVRDGVVEEDLQSYLSIPSMFERIEEDLERLNPDEVIFWVTFDPTYGFVTDYALGPSHPHDFRVIQFSNFRPVRGEVE